MISVLFTQTEQLTKHIPLCFLQDDMTNKNIETNIIQKKRLAERLLTFISLIFINFNYLLETTLIVTKFI